jgi:hypothetical protein
MIRYALICDKGHEFESWFADSAAYDRQAKHHLVACPLCNSSKVEKAIMAPRVITAKKRKTPNIKISTTPESPAKESPVNTQMSVNAETRTPVAMISSAEQEFRAKLKEVRDHIIKNADNVGTKFPEEARKMHYGEIEQRSIYGVASAKDVKELADEGIPFQPLPILPDDRN